MTREHEARTLSVCVSRDLPFVYGFLADPQNFPQWAAGLCSAIERHGEAWIAQTSSGPVPVRFTEPNPFGILDHTVQPAPGSEVYVPMRALAHGDGTVVTLTLLRLPGVSAEAFAHDLSLMQADLLALKRLLET